MSIPHVTVTKGLSAPYLTPVLAEVSRSQVGNAESWEIRVTDPASEQTLSRCLGILIWAHHQKLQTPDGEIFGILHVDESFTDQSGRAYSKLIARIIEKIAAALREERAYLRALGKLLEGTDQPVTLSTPLPEIPVGNIIAEVAAEVELDIGGGRKSGSSWRI